MIRLLACILALICCLCHAQTSTSSVTSQPAPPSTLTTHRLHQPQVPKPKAPVKCKTLAACQAQVTLLQQGNDAILDDWRRAMDDVDRLKTENAELAKKYDNAMTILGAVNNHINGKDYTEEQLKKIKEMGGSEALSLGASIETEQNKLASYTVKVSDHDAQAVEKYNSLLADYKDYVNRVSIQLAQIGQANRINNALQLYQIMRPSTQNLNITVSDCTKLPALCIH